MPVIDHPIHDRTREGPDARWGCHNRPEFAAGYWAPGGMVPAYAGSTQMHVQMVFVRHAMSRVCKNDIAETDPKCAGCNHIGERDRRNEK